MRINKKAIVISVLSLSNDFRGYALLPHRDALKMISEHSCNNRFQMRLLERKTIFGNGGFTFLSHFDWKIF